MRIVAVAQKSLAVLAATVISGCASYAQTVPQFTRIKATAEGAIQLYWQSEPNSVYRIDYADQLADSNLGYTVWKTLYDQYPSHGTNTFWLDTGTYLLDSPVPHPKFTSGRFYRIFNEGTNSGAAPSVAVNFPTNGAVLSGGINVSVGSSSPYPCLICRVYVDGQEMWPSEDGTNYFINTCEWANGPHMIFATAKALSDYPGPSGALGIFAGRAVSAYVPVTFSNLISRVAFSQWFFEPSLGQTQQVTASFAAPVNWTLQILDGSSNAVRTATGSGGSLVFNWDGTGNGGTAIPDGVYQYSISAQTNGQAFASEGPGSGNSGVGPPLPASLSSTGAGAAMELFAMPLDGSGAAVPLGLYPPGCDTNRLAIFGVPSLEASGAGLPNMVAMEARSVGTAPMYSGASSQSTAAPTRSPTSGVKNAVNSYGLAYWDYPDGRSLGIPGNGQPLPLHVHLDGTTLNSLSYEALWDGGSTQGSLAASFRERGWKQAFVRFDNNLSSHDLRRSDQGYGGGELFTTVTIGVFLSHGSYGTDPDYSSGSSGSKQIYFPSGNSGDSGVNTYDSGWLRMCQFGFGGSLKWMAFGACYSLTDPNYGSMSSVGAIPLKTTHLLCGATTQSLAVSGVYLEWGDRLLGPQHETVVQAWFDAGKIGYQYTRSNEPPIIFRVTGYPECIGDTIATNTEPSNPSAAPRGLTQRTQQVWPAQ